MLFGGLDIADKKYSELYRLVVDVFSPDREGEMENIIPVNAFIGAYLRIEVLGSTD